MAIILPTRSFVSPGALLGFLVLLSPAPARGQDLVPGAYTPAPTGVNIVTIAANISHGNVTLDPSLPVEDGRANIGGLAVGFNRTLGIAGRSGSVGAVVPYLNGHFQGSLLGEFQEVSRSGAGDLGLRIAVNVYGAPVMTRQEFAAYRPNTIVGISLSVGTPVGRYLPDKVINIGTNRWSFKPEFGISRRRGRWTFEGDVGMTLFTDNTNFLNGGVRQQASIGSFQGHLIYTVRPGLWLAGDANFWRGGRNITNGVEASEQQKNSRAGVTLALPVGRQQVRIAYSFGAYTRLGGDFQAVGVSYSYAWAHRP